MAVKEEQVMFVVFFPTHPPGTSQNTHCVHPHSIMKILLLGEVGVGKTTLLSRLAVCFSHTPHFQKA